MRHRPGVIVAYVLIVMVAAGGLWRVNSVTTTNRLKLQALVCTVTTPIALPTTGDPSRTINRNKQLAHEREVLIGDHQC